MINMSESTCFLDQVTEDSSLVITVDLTLRVNSYPFSMRRADSYFAQRSKERAIETINHRTKWISSHLYS